MKRIAGPLVIVLLLVAIWRIVVHGNPGGISDEEYARYEALKAPKVLYSCTRQPSREWLTQQKRKCMDSGRADCEEDVDESSLAEPESVVDFAGGDATATYEGLVESLRQACMSARGHFAGGQFAVLESDKG